MEQQQYANGLKSKRKIATFSATPRRGPKPKWTMRHEALYKALVEMERPVTVDDLMAHKVAAQYVIRGRARIPTSFQDLKRELMYLVENNLATWAVDGEPEGGRIRVPTEPEVSYGRKNNEEAWVRSGFMFEAAPNVWEPYRINNILFRRTDTKPHGKSKVASLWAAIPATHHARMEDLELGSDIRETFPTARRLFEALMQLHQEKAVEVVPVGL